MSCERATYNGRDGWFVAHTEGPARDGVFYRDDGEATFRIAGATNRQLLSLHDSTGAPPKARERDLKTAHRHLSTVGAALLASPDPSPPEHQDLMLIAATVIAMFAHNRGERSVAVSSLRTAVERLRSKPEDPEVRVAYEKAQKIADVALAKL